LKSTNDKTPLGRVPLSLRVDGLVVAYERAVVEIEKVLVG
jgi:hypothetical protein